MTTTPQPPVSPAPSDLAFVALDPVIARACERLGDAPLSPAGLAEHIFPLFSRVRAGLGDTIYLANHSLGLPLDLTAEHVRAGLDLWYTQRDGAWTHWLAEMDSFRAAIAALIGCSHEDAVVPKSSAGQGLRAVLNALPNQRPRILTTSGEFDSGDFILKSYVLRNRADVVWIDPRVAPARHLTPVFDADDVLAALRSACPHFDLLFISRVFFTTGQVLHRLPEIVRAARQLGTLVMVDEYHAAGCLPINFDELDADFAVGGSYKYTRGGPGVGWLCVHPRHLADHAAATPRIRTLDTGWFAKNNCFAFQRPDFPETSAGGDAWLESTPPILPLYQAKAGLQLTLALGVERLRDYRRQQILRLAGLLQEQGVEVHWPDPDPARCGPFLLVPTNDVRRLSSVLAESHIIADGRGHYLRLCPDILTTDAHLITAAHAIAAAVWAVRDQPRPPEFPSGN